MATQHTNAISHRLRIDTIHNISYIPNIVIDSLYMYLASISNFRKPLKVPAHGINGSNRKAMIRTWSHLKPNPALITKKGYK